VLCRVKYLWADVSEVRAPSIIRDLIMKAARTSETSLDNYFTRQYIPEDSELRDSCLNRISRSRMRTDEDWFPNREIIRKTVDLH
jgi:hypothetical protein